MQRRTLANPYGIALLAVILTLAVAGCTHHTAPAAPSAAASADSRGQVAANAPPTLPPGAAFPTYGFATLPPPGWNAVPADQIGLAAHWARVDKATDEILADIRVEMEPAKNRTLAQKVEEANKVGVIKEEAITLAGVPATRLEYGPRGKAAQREAVFSANYGHFYTIVGSAVTGEKLRDTMQALCKSWMWRPLEASTAHLQMRTQPLSLFDGLLRIRSPEIMRMLPPEGDLHLRMGIYDARTQEAALMVEIQILPNAEGLSLTQLCDRFASELQTRLQLTNAPIWHVGKGATSYYLTKPFLTTLSTTSYKPTTVLYGLLEIDDANVCLFTFTITGQDDPTQQAYETVCDQIMDSVTVSTPGP